MYIISVSAKEKIRPIPEPSVFVHFLYCCYIIDGILLLVG